MHLISKSERLESIERLVLLELISSIKDLENLLETKIRSFNLAIQLAKGKTLLLGEGNFSFSLSLAKTRLIKPTNLIATTFDKESEASKTAMENAQNLGLKGTKIIFGVDATDLYSTFKLERFDNIVFQFPNVASREAVEGQNPNHILVRDFLKSAKANLSYTGRVFISAVDSPYYNGVFNFDEAAEKSGFKTPRTYPFDPLDFPGYEHTMTHQDESAIEEYDKFTTWVFVPE